MRRILALVAAIAMVVGAVVVRRVIDDNSTASVTQPTRGGPLRVVCSPELGDICSTQLFGADSVVTVEEPLVTLDRLAKSETPADVDVDAWLAPGPWGELLTAERERRGVAALGRSVDTLAQSALVLVSVKTRTPTLVTECVSLTPKCVPATAGRPWDSINGDAAWGRVKTAIADPLRTGTGLVAAGAITQDFFGRSDLASSDLDASPEYTDALRNLAVDVQRRPDIVTPVRAMLTRAGDYDLVLAAEADARLIRVRVSESRFRIDCVRQTATVSIRPVLFGEVDEKVINPITRQAFADEGWSVTGTRPADTLASTSCPTNQTGGIPAVLLLHIADLWRQAN